MSTDLYERNRMTPVSMLRVGDLVDLAGDPFADPESDNISLECEYAVVCEVAREADDCIAVGFEGFDVVGFPPDHIVWVGGHDNGYNEAEDAP
jgi:hypothetical protein